MSVTSDPVRLVEAAVAALNAGDFAAVAALCDPVSLRAHQRALVDHHATIAAHPGPTVDEYLRSAPDMPREVAEYHVAQFARHRPDGRALVHELPGIATREALHAASPEAVFVAWLEGRSHRGQLRRAVAEGRLSAAAAERQRDVAFVEHDLVVLGTVPGGDGLAHVVCRRRMHPATFDDPAITAWLARQPAEEQALTRQLWGAPPRVETCRRQADGTWRLIADHDFFEIGAMHAIIADDPDDDGAPAGAPPAVDGGAA